MPRLSLIAVLVMGSLAGGPPPARADDGQCLEAGLTAAKQGRWSAAVEGFQAALARPACAGERTTLLFNIASATQNQAEAVDDPALACTAVRRYQAYLDAEGDAGLVAERLSAMKTRCAARPIEVAAAAPPPITEWVLTGSAVAGLATGAVLYGLALESIDARDAAATRYRLAPDPTARATAAADFDTADGQATRRGYASYALLGAGALLAVGAAWAWLDDDGPAVTVAPGGVGVSGRF